MIKGKFNLYAYFSFLFTLAIFIVSIYLFVNPHLLLKGKTGHTFPAPLVGFIFLILTSLLFYVFAKVIYLVTIDTNSISIKGVFKRKKIEIPEIRSIDLFSKEDFHWSAGSITIGTRIDLENGEKIIIADPFYRNIESLKQTLSENFKDKLKVYRAKKTNHSTSSLLETDFEKFSGNPHTSVNGLLLYGIVIMFTAMFLYKQNLQLAHLFLIIPVSIFYLGFGSQLNYFLLSNKRLVVKNHILFWINKIYDIDDIVQVNFESHHKRSDALRITTTNFKSKHYSAGSLRRKNWTSLKEKLKELNLHFVE